MASVNPQSFGGAVPMSRLDHQGRVVVRDGQAVVAKVMPLSLACDHRVVDGATAALALAEIVKLLSDPESLLR